MEINASQLLKGFTGATREYQISEILNVSNDGNGHLVKGTVTLVRTHHGVLAKGVLHTEAELVCSRCLTHFLSPLTLNIEEEYLPAIDVVSGLPLPPPDDPEDFTIDENHILDLTEAIRQYTLLAIPMKPLCREDCAGLCPTCGHNLNLGACDCPQPGIDPRLSKLLKLLKD